MASRVRARSAGQSRFSRHGATLWLKQQAPIVIMLAVHIDGVTALDLNAATAVTLVSHSWQES